MAVDYETLMRFADGDLPPDEAARVAAAIRADPSLAAQLERMRSVGTSIKRAYDHVTDEPIPAHLLALLGTLAGDKPEQEPRPQAEPAQDRAPEPVVDLAAARERKRLRFGAPAWSAIAASLVLGLLVGRMAAPESLLQNTSRGLLAGSALERTLDQQIAGQAGDAPMRVGLSFRTRDGGYCRTFTHESGMSGLACREGDDWAVRVAVQEEAAHGGYRQAGAAAPAVLEAVDSLIYGEPLDAAGEEAARARGWR